MLFKILTKNIFIFTILLASSCSVLSINGFPKEKVYIVPKLENGIYVIDQELFTVPNRCYIIRNKCSLLGATIKIPDECTLEFKRDANISDGVLYGNDTKIQASNKQIFANNLILKGSFSAKAANPLWLGIIPDCQLDGNFKYISGTNWHEKFQQLLLFDNIQLAHNACYFIKGHLSLKTGQNFDGNYSTIKWAYTEYASLFEVGSGNGYKYVENTEMYNLCIIGNKLEADDVTEQCHGIRIGYAKSIYLHDIKIQYCRGDGVYVGSNLTIPERKITPIDICVERVECKYNHRQGMSITRVKGLIIKDSDFSYTSGTLPEAGIDIEPNVRRDESGKIYATECQDIKITNCQFVGNKGAGLLMGRSYCNATDLSKIVYNVNVDNCNIFQNPLSVTGGNNISISNCTLINSQINLLTPGYIQDLSFVNTEIICNIPDNDLTAVTMKYSGSSTLIKNLLFDKVYITGFGGYGIYIPNRLKGTYDTPVFYVSGLTILNSKIEQCAVPLYIGKNANNVLVSGNTFKAIPLNLLNSSQKSIRAESTVGVFMLDDKSTHIDENNITDDQL